MLVENNKIIFRNRTEAEIIELVLNQYRKEHPVAEGIDLITELEYQLNEMIMRWSEDYIKNRSPIVTQKQDDKTYMAENNHRIAV